MAQEINATRAARTRIAIETAYGSLTSLPATFVDVFPSAQPDLSGLAQEEIDNESESTNGFDEQDQVHGLRSGSPVKFPVQIRPDGTQLANSSTPPVMHALNVLCRAAFGNDDSSAAANCWPPMAAAGAGTLTVGTPTPTTAGFSVTPGTGALLKPGAGLLVEIGTPGSGILYPTRIKSVTTDAVALSIPLPSAPGTGAKVVGMYSFGISQSDASSLAFQHAKVQGANQQWTTVGNRVDLELTLERGKAPAFNVTLTGADWLGPVAQGIPITAGTDTLGAPFSLTAMTCLLQLASATTRVHYPVESVSFKWAATLQHLPETGGVQGTTGLIRVPNRKFCKATVRIRNDMARYTNWTNLDKLTFYAIAPQGAGLSLRALMAGMPLCVIDGAPKFINGDYAISEFTLKSKKDQTTTGTSDLALTPFFFGLG